LSSDGKILKAATTTTGRKEKKADLLEYFSSEDSAAEIHQPTIEFQRSFKIYPGLKGIRLSNTKEEN
jgi:hypothetical protein